MHNQNGGMIVLAVLPTYHFTENITNKKTMKMLLIHGGGHIKIAHNRVEIFLKMDQ
tara:strand:+ start:494 stop:661 length:168 start_codon:yes stop_codon:yes gene_type:complete